MAQQKTPSVFHDPAKVSAEEIARFLDALSLCQPGDVVQAPPWYFDRSAVVFYWRDEPTPAGRVAV